MEEKKEVIITGLKIPFWDLVWFMVKFTLASIPAFVILYGVFWLLSFFFGALIALPF
ncbi:hypothetical protein NitYY0826_C1949 [Nitratiruptor sp. YY08-26]|uniref:Uncharacterized protein n=1 Tax=Nitratiruptor tergarcus DSM 16512 TaxID=1069081 RepID=A0A1W1WQV2_9BACT|nr:MULTISPECIES: hypothetical protein [unclassified Nitratiruptor]BCD63059.1 hypothetical protein NitYY0813_C1947 [Nitratiruptor sp. YY08-13]BCD66994.1 hypothetical protein NitYY0826_C1949 [Nitratiruptor sp. YY08-26]SMC08579.1 hypothetical protein SAMN05660197_0336 [Nitratiruptor tergarcus DSM 16512]